MKPQDVAKRAILATLAGSHAYGTSTPTSDIDVRGVFTMPREYRDGFAFNIEQSMDQDVLKGLPPLPSRVQNNTEYGLDCTLFELKKFMHLAAGANPNILDILFSDDSDLFLQTEGGRLLRKHRDLFLSQRVVHTFAGYAFSQMKRIKGHRSWLLNPPTHKPTREEYGLSSEPFGGYHAIKDSVAKVVNNWQLDFGDLGEAEKININATIVEHITDINDDVVNARAAAAKIGLGVDVTNALLAENKYQSAIRQWNSYQTWERERNPKRAALEAKFGYDTKHGMHLVRLMTMLLELLEHGTLSVRRPDAAFLLSIREGLWGFEQLEGWFGEAQNKIDSLRKGCTLPKTPNVHWLNDLCMEIYRLEGE